MKKCIFCDHVIGAKEGARPRAREHIFASWVLREYGIEKDEISYSRFESEAGATTTKLNILTALTLDASRLNGKLEYVEHREGKISATSVDELPVWAERKDMDPTAATCLRVVQPHLEELTIT